MMAKIQYLILLFAIGYGYDNCNAFSTSSLPSSPGSSTRFSATSTVEDTTSTSSSSDSTKRVGINSRGAKMNEIDFTLAPSDVSLSRCYQMSGSTITSTESNTRITTENIQSQSLTRALNTASNRAIRRILLARSWPSAEALNLSLRTILMQQQQKEQNVVKAGLVVEEEMKTGGVEDLEGGSSMDATDDDKMKCPVPRPILNILTKKSRSGDGPIPAVSGDDTSSNDSSSSMSSEDREKQWIQNQLSTFSSQYSTIPNYKAAEAYLESILVLATSGIESPRVIDILADEIYVDSYMRILSVIQSVGAVLIEDEKGGRRRISKKLNDIDICLSMLDKISLVNERKEKDAAAEKANEKVNPLAIDYDAAIKLAFESAEEGISFDDFKEAYVADTIDMVSAKWKAQWEDEVEEEEEGKKKKRRPRLAFLCPAIREKEADTPAISRVEEKEDSIVINPDDLGGVLLSAEEPTMTRQLNVLSNIVQRTLIFGGDQELLVLAETLDADKPAFIQRWYKDDQASDIDIQNETRPGVQYLNSLIQLLRDCYTKGVLTDVSPTSPLSTGYLNAYGRLTASLIELGSGYIRPSSSLSPISLAPTKYLKSTTPPKTAKEELNRFAQWERAVRKNNENPYPDDIVGTWVVQDIVGTQRVGSTEVTFKPQGEVSVKPPMQGLRWRLDPGPTHLDTCTFQVLSDDGAILQYKGFVDRGSRLEARVSKRSVSMRGGVSFLMRDADGGTSEDFWNDMVPIGTLKSGTTKFIMSRDVNSEDAQLQSGDSSSLTSSLGAGLRCAPVAEGDRQIITGPSGPILVTKVAGSYYAVDATCPHLNLPMKKGKVTIQDGQPTLTCSFHNSCFEMKTGKCTKWVTGALGNENEFISNVMGSLGSEQKDITAYQVTEEADGSLTVTSETKSTITA